jgi:hypothetical protein
MTREGPRGPSSSSGERRGGPRSRGAGRGRGGGQGRGAGPRSGDGGRRGGDGRSTDGAAGRGEGARARAEGDKGEGRRRDKGRRDGRGPKSGAAELAPLTARPKLDLDRAADAPLSEVEQKEAEQHLAFLRRFKAHLRLSLNAREDLLVNGAKAPDERGVLKHLFSKVDRATVEKALSRDPLRSDAALRTAFLAGVVRLDPDPHTLLGYLEAVAASQDRRIAAQAFGATVARVDFSALSPALLGRLLEVCRAAFAEHDRVQALLGLFDVPSFAAAAARAGAQLPTAVQEELLPLAAAHHAVSSQGPLPADDAQRALISAGVSRWLAAPAEVLRSYPLEHRVRLAEFAVAAADGTAPDALPPTLMDSIPRDHARYLRLGLLWSEKLVRGGQVEAARGVLRQLVVAHPDHRDAARRLKALEGARIGSLLLQGEVQGGLEAAFFADGALHGYAEVAQGAAADALEARARWQVELLLPGVAPVLAAGRHQDRAWLLLAASGQPLAPARRGLREALGLAADALRILRALALAGVELPAAEPTRFWQRGRGGALELVDLSGAVRTDPTRAAMGLAGPAQALARALLWDDRADALRSDLPAELATRLAGRAPLQALVRGLVEACQR